MYLGCDDVIESARGGHLQTARDAARVDSPQ